MFWGWIYLSFSWTIFVYKINYVWLLYLFGSSWILGSKWVQGSLLIRNTIAFNYLHYIYNLELSISYFQAEFVPGSSTATLLELEWWLKSLGHHGRFTTRLVFLTILRLLDPCAHSYFIYDVAKMKKSWIFSNLLNLNKLTCQPKHGSTLVCYLLRTGRTQVQIPARDDFSE